MGEKASETDCLCGQYSISTETTKTRRVQAKEIEDQGVEGGGVISFLATCRLRRTAPSCDRFKVRGKEGHESLTGISRGGAAVPLKVSRDPT